MPRFLIYRAAREMGLLGQGNVLLLESEEDMGYVMDRCLYDIPWEGASLLERFIASHGAGLGPEDAGTLESMADAYYSLFEIVAVVPENNAIELKDLFGERSCSITDVHLSHSIIPGILMATRIVGIGDLHMTTGAACPFEPDHRNALLGGLRPRRPAQGEENRKAGKDLGPAHARNTAPTFSASTASLVISRWRR